MTMVMMMRRIMMIRRGTSFQGGRDLASVGFLEAEVHKVGAP